MRGAFTVAGSRPSVRLVGAALLALAGLLASAEGAAQCPPAEFPVARSVESGCQGGACTMSVTWDPVAGATASTRYRVYRALLTPQSSGYCGTIGTFNFMDLVAAPGYSFTGIPAGSVVIWTVTVDGCPDNPYQWFWVWDFLTAPAAVPTLTGSLNTRGDPVLRFTPPDSNTFSHTLQRSRDGASWSDVADWVMGGDLFTGITVGGYCPPGSSQSYTDEGLATGTYFYRLQTVPSYAGGGGPSNVVQLSVVGQLPVITGFTASPAAITAGQSSTLTWSSVGGLTATIDGGIGPVTPSGSLTVKPAASTTYTLTVTNPVGSVKASTAVVVCGSPAAPVASGPSGGAASGGVFNLGWTDVLLADTAGIYESQLALDSSFSQPVTTQKTSVRTAAFTVPSSAGSAVYARVRAINACGVAGAWSNVVTVPVAHAPALVILTQGQSPAWSVKRGDPLPAATLRFRNVGETAASVVFATASGSFFTVFPPSATLAGGQEAVVTLTGAAGATSATGLYQGFVGATWGNGSVAATVTLAVADTLADVVPAVDVDSIYNLASGTGVSTQTVNVTNPSGGPITLAASVGPGGAWLTVEPADLAGPLGAGQTRPVRLRIDRSKRTSADGPPPLFTLLTLTSVGGSAGRQVRVFDAEPPVVTQTSERALWQAAAPTFIVPSAVHSAGAASSLFTSDGWIRNLSASPITVELLASERDRWDQPSLKTERTLPGLSLIRLYDFVQGAFGRTDLSANVEIRPKTPADAAQLVVRVTVEGQPAGGVTNQRFSSEIPVYASGTGTGVGLPALVIAGVDVTDAVRTNVILSETTGSGVSVNLKLTGADGTVLGQTASPVFVGPYGVTQNSIPGYLGLPSGVTIRSASLRIEGASGAGRCVALGTAIDNVSQSFRALSAETERTAAAGAGHELAAIEVRPVVIPSIVHSGGVGAFFTTRLEVRNETATNAPLTFVYTYAGQDDQGNGVDGEKRVDRTIGPRQSLVAEVGDDAVVNLMGLPKGWKTSGPLRVEGAGVAQVIVKSWVQTVADETRPQENVKFAEFRGYQASSAEVVGVGGTAVVLSSGVAKMLGQRTNLILTEVSGQPAQVRVKLVDGASGQQIGASDPITVGAYQKLQINNPDLWPLLKLPDGERDRMQMVLEAVGPGTGRVAGVLTQIDNSTLATLVTAFAPAGPQSPGIGIGR